MAALAFIANIAKGNMKKVLPIIFASFLLSSCIQDNLEQPVKPAITSTELTAIDFVKGSEDIPLLTNLELVESDNVDFDSESGSFATVEYRSQIDLEAVQGFYLKTLPQMGWNLTKNDLRHSNFTRENENVKIEFVESDEEGGDDLVVFSLSSVTRK